jgi:hypothetical protein
MTPDNSGMPPLPTLARWVANDYHPNTPVYDASEADAAMLAYGRQVAQMCAEICRDAACGGSAFNSAAEYIEAAINKRFGLEKP